MRTLRREELDMLLPGAMPSPRRSLRTKAIIAVVLLVTAPTALTGVIVFRQSVHAIHERLMHDSRVLATTASHVLAQQLGDVGEEMADAQETLMQMSRDPRVAFMVITDARGRVLAQHYNEPLAYHAYERQLTPQERSTPLTLNRSVSLTNPDDTLLVVRRQIIHGRAKRDTGAAATSGYLEMGLHDPTEAQTLKDLQDAVISVVSVICLISIVLIVWWVRGWVEPLRRMLTTMTRLSVGGRFSPVHLDRDDEIGLLGDSLNAMAQNLIRIQHALIEANEQLERKVQARTAELKAANEHLRREMNEKDQFLRAVSHDLGAPLRNIAGLTKLLMVKHRDQISDDIVQKLDRIAANVRVETDLINDLLELGRIKSRPGKKQQIDLNELVTSVGEQLAYELEERDITLDVRPGLPAVQADRNRLRQVFQNLIDNAVKYMPEDAQTRRIVVGARQWRGRPCLFVSDTGRGIAPEDQQAIFQVFKRAQYSGRQSAPGRGVGLATVKAIIESHEGEIWVESHPPHGATFLFTLGDVTASQASTPETIPA